MKRFSICSGLLFLLFGFTNVNGNLLSNPGFEKWVDGAPENWDRSSSSYFFYEETIWHGGSLSLKIELKSTTQVKPDISQLVPVQAGWVYTFSAYVYDNNPDGELGLLINWRTVEDNDISTIWSGRSTTETGWKGLAIYDREAPSNAAFARVRIKAYGDVGPLYVDDANFYGDQSLPVTVSSFQGQYTGDAVVLKWTTEEEKDIVKFEIMRSVCEAGPFETIAQLFPQYKQYSGMSGGSYQYLDLNFPISEALWYCLEEQNENEVTETYGPISVSCLFNHESETSGLCGVYPNPFNPTTKIRYRVSGEFLTQALVIYDIQGRLVRKFDITQEMSGEYIQSWDGRNQSGEALAGGVYVVVLISDGTPVATQKMLKLH